MSKIQMITAREILDSRGNPTVEVEIVLACGARGKWKGKGKVVKSPFDLLFKMSR